MNRDKSAPPVVGNPPSFERDLIANVLLVDSEEAFFVLDPNWRFVYLNHAAERLVRSSRDQLLGQNVWEMFPEAVGTLVWHEYHRAASEKVPVAFEDFYSPLETWFEVRAYPRDDLLVVHFRDITERKQAQAALERSEERFQLLAQATGDVIWDYDFRADRLWWSEQFTQLFGYAPGEVGHTFASWEERVHPEDRLRASRSVEAATEAQLSTGSVEYRFRRADGSYADVLDRMHFLYDDQGRPRRAVGVLIDLGEQKAAERHHRFLAEAGEALVSTLDYDQRLRDVARLCAGPLADLCVVDIRQEDGHVRRVELAAADPKIERLVSRLRRFPPTLSRPVGVAKVLETGERLLVERVSDVELERVAQSAEHLELLRALGPRTYLVLPLQTRGETLGTLTLVNTTPGRRFQPRDVALAEDVARRAALDLANARLHADVEAARQEAEEASRAKGRILSIMGHDLRNPVSAIGTFSQLLAMETAGPLTPRQREYVEHITATTGHIDDLIGQVLTYARSEAGAEALDLSRVDVTETAREVAGLLAPQAVLKGVELEVHLSADPVEIETDVSKLHQILMNVLGNAIKFTEQGRVTLEVHRVDRKVEFRVHDTGPGIAPDDMGRIFHPFERGEARHGRSQPGMGLGLAISRHFARVLGGEIELESEIGQGSMFCLHLPCSGSGQQAEGRLAE